LEASRASVRRVLPEAHGPPADQIPTKGPATEIAWLETYPDAALDSIADAAPGPNAPYEMREAVQLAFVAAIQHLPPRPRAVLLLCDVLSSTAAETARMLDASVASVNSALPRARATLAKEFPAGRPSSQAVPDDQQRVLLEAQAEPFDGGFEQRLAMLLQLPRELQRLDVALS
jgi:RNA polymerase sigma-70 factor, ECF subfamily